MASPPPRLIAIVGPTASGKSAAALALAEEESGEIVSCDSLSVYRGLDIGSAKPGPEERARVRHHGLDLVDVDEEFSAAAWLAMARAAIQDIETRGRLAIVAGGTGLYLRALTHGLFEGPSRDEALRRRLEGLAARHGRARVHRLLRAVDPEAAARLAPGDLVRVVRALEIVRATRHPLSASHRATEPGLPGHRIAVFGISLAREELLARVERRTDAMLQAGLLDEVRGLLARGHVPTLRPLQAIGYREAVAVALGAADESGLRHAIVGATMRYAKRQRTWFRHQADVTWFEDGTSLVAAARSWLRSAP